MANSAATKDSCDPLEGANQFVIGEDDSDQFEALGIWVQVDQLLRHISNRQSFSRALE